MNARIRGYDASRPVLNPAPPAASHAFYEAAIMSDGCYIPHRHGQPWVHLLQRWTKALEQNNQPEAAACGHELLQLALSVGALPEVVNGALHPAMAATLQRIATNTTAAVAGAGALGSGLGLGARESDLEAIDWREPDSSLYYELDERSGVELRKIVKLLKHPDQAAARGARPPNRLLLVGPSGCGKTQGALWLASQLETTVALIRIDATMIGQVGAIARRVRNCFEEAHERGAVVVIDEFEALAVPRNNLSPNVPQWSRETTSALLQLFDDPKLENLTVVACTNYLPLVDEAVRRRLRRHVVFHPPGRSVRDAMLRRWWEKVPREDGVMNRLVDLTEGHSGDVLQRAAEEANLLAIDRSLNAAVTVADVEAAFANVTATALPVMPALAVGGAPGAV